MMKDGLLEKIAALINENSQLFSAEIPSEEMPYMKLDGVTLGETKCRVIRITRKGKSKNHHIKSQWSLFEIDIEKTIVKMTRKEKKFSERIELLTLNLSDVETIIRRTSYQLLKLKLAPTAFERIKDMM